MTQYTKTIFECCRDNDPEGLLHYLAMGVDPDEEDGMDRSLLLIAANYDSVECLQILLEAGANTEVRDCLLETPIFSTIKNFSTDCLKLLLKYGATPNVKNRNGMTLLNASIMDGSDECFEVLVNHPNIDLNLQNYEKPYTRDMADWTPLHMAAFTNSKERMKKLLDYGADGTIKNKNRQTFLDMIKKKELREEMREYMEFISTIPIKQPSS